MLHSSPEYSRFRLRLIGGLLTIACLAIVAVSWKIYSSAYDRENAARGQAQAYTHAIAAHVSDAIEFADFALLGFVNAIKVLPAEKEKSAEIIQQLLKSNDTATVDSLRMTFIDANGIVVATSRSMPVQGVSYADRDYFQAHAGTGLDRGLFVSEPLLGKITGRWAFVLSRRVTNARGRFMGIIAVPMDATRFASMFENARFDQNDISISLVHQDGKLIACAPMFEQSVGTNILHSNFFRQLQGVSAKTFQANSPVDGQPMIYSFRALDNRPLAVYVGISVLSLSQALHKDLLIGGAGIMLMVMIMLLSARFALQSYLRLNFNKQALQESEIRWKFALEGAGEGVWEWNVVSNEVHFSYALKQMIGFARDEIEDTFDAWEYRIHMEDKPHVTAALQACLDQETQTYVSEYRMQCKDGSWKWILARGMVIARDAAGQALRMIGTHSDITDRKHAEQAQVHKIVEAAPDPMLLVANDGIIAFANGAAQSTFGYTFNELIGQNVDRLVLFNSSSSHLHWRSIVTNGKDPYPWAVAAMHRDGTRFSVEISLSPIQMDGQPVVIAGIRDVTESKRAAELLQQSFTQLRRLSDHQQKIKEDERKRIAQDIHNDLGQNLLALKMDVVMLYARNESAHSKQNKLVSVVLDNIEATIKSVKSIMNDLRPATLELGLYPAVEWQLKQFERRSGIVCRLASIAPEDEYGLDEVRTMAVFRILQESLTNVARHAMATEVEIALSRNERGFSMLIQDNGRGLQQTDRRKKNSFGLMGIKERIHELGGEFVIASSPDSGTVLSIFLATEESEIES